MPPPQEVIHRAKHFLEQNFDRRISLKSLARYLGISSAYLSSLFHREYGITISKYLTSLRLEAARRLLQSSRMQVSEIASHCGFSSSSYFIKAFSNHYNVTPRNYALKVRNFDDTKK